MFKNKNKQFLKKIIIKSISCNCISCNFFFFFLSKCIFVLICLYECVCVWVCLCASEEKEEDEKLLSLLSPQKREKKRSKREISKIINGRATVIVYINMVTVACVEIYTFLHNFKNTDVEDFWGKMCKNGCFLYFAKVYTSWRGCS